MKVVQINATCGSGSTGKICISISKALSKRCIENYVLYSMGQSQFEHAIKYCCLFTQKIQSFFEIVTGLYGFGAFISTRTLIRQLDKIRPDIVHIHNIHTHDCNLVTLFKYLKRNKIKVFWTFHDCWAFTGYCTYFDFAECNKWKSQCEKCPLYKQYSLILDKSLTNFKKKKNTMEDMDLEIITPSKWLESLCKESFLAKYPVHVINNGIDLNLFKPVQSDFRKKYNCEDKMILLGVAMKWECRKGLGTFIKLSQDLDESYQIVLIGTDEQVDLRLPKKVISLHHTKNQQELAAIYSAADLLINPTLEENFPTVNIESIACGTPVLTYNTGGSSEMIDEKSGIVIERFNYNQLLETLRAYKNNRCLKSQDCLDKSREYNQNEIYEEYLRLYIKH